MKIDSFQVVPALPKRLQGLREMAYNLLWSWDEELRAVFTRLDRDLWERTYQNPVLMLGTVSQKRLDELMKDDSYLSFYERTYQHFRSYLKEPTWWQKRYDGKPLVAYFSAEFGLAECLPIYSGGLGLLAAHHLKSASDLGVPLVGVGLLYQQGYFRQYLTSDGWQQESYPVNDFYNLPVQPALGPDSKQLTLALSMAGKPLAVRVWRAEVGRLPLILLDTNVPENPKELQDITDQLYGGDRENRIRQEIVLGIGGLRALHALGLKPAVCHMNEGHSAFLALERIRCLMRDEKLTFAEALEVARSGCIFTTHTPVPAGFDVFSPELIDRYFGEYIQEVGITRERLLAMGRSDPNTPTSGFNMAGLALRASAFANGVSRLHGQISREILHTYLPVVPADELPVGYVTNGAHTRSCVSKEMATLFDRYLGPEWWQKPGQAATWEDVDTIPDEELWSTHERRRERLVAFARKRLMSQLERRGASQRDIERARGVLNTRTLTIGFARRFATYKRANLILRDYERIKNILTSTDRPVQIIFAGKAHPKDNEGKDLLKTVVNFCSKDEIRRNAVFLEDYDIVIARYLVQGVDIWLNTPRRKMEASGTSGMKVLPNGGLNFSILDGWWCEGYSPEVGWAIGKGEDYDDFGYQDHVESNALYDILENEIVPLFYSRSADGLPHGWIARMKTSMRKLSPQFSTNRMIWEYAERFYIPAAAYHGRMTENNNERAKGLAKWKRFIVGNWNDVSVQSVVAKRPDIHRVGEGFEVTADVRLGKIQPSDVSVEVYFGPLDAQRQITDAKSKLMQLESGIETGLFRYAGTVPCEQSGMYGYAVRVRPSHPDANNLMVTGLMRWY